MKQYNPKTKKCETRTEDVSSLKKSHLCKGKRLHNFELVLPEYIARNIDENLLSHGVINSYYAIEDKRLESDKYYDTLICNLLGTNALGKKWKNEVCRWETCTNCGKKK